MIGGLDDKECESERDGGGETSIPTSSSLLSSSSSWYSERAPYSSRRPASEWARRWGNVIVPTPTPSKAMPSR